MSPRELEIRAEEPARQVDGALRLPDRGGDPRKRGGAVHEHFDAIALAHGEGVWSDVCGGRIQGSLPADPAQTTTVMSAYRAFHRVPEGGADTSKRVRKTGR